MHGFLGSIFPLHCLGMVHPAPCRGEGIPGSRNYFGRDWKIPCSSYPASYPDTL